MIKRRPGWNPSKLKIYGAGLLAGLAVISVLNWREWKRSRKSSSLSCTVPGDEWVRSAKSLPRVSALVAAWNESSNIEQHIESFLKLRYPAIELVVSAGGDDGTYERALRYAGGRITVIRQAVGEGKQTALSSAYQHSTGVIIYFTDADCIFSDEAIERVLAPIILEKEQAATGSSRPLDAQLNQLLPSHIWAREIAASKRHNGYIQGILGRNAAITRDAIERSGGLEFAAPTGTDYHLAQRLLRIGTPIRYIADSVVPSSYPTSVGDYRSRQSRWLRNLILFGGQYGARADVVATCKTIGLGLTMTFLPLAALLVGPIAIALWLLLLTHATLARIRYMNELSRSGLGPTPPKYALLAAPLTMLDFAVCALPVVDLLDKRKRKKW
jgi:glycosyltransferase involved in cell wall biosynthesis